MLPDTVSWETAPRFTWIFKKTLEDEKDKNRSETLRFLS